MKFIASCSFGKDSLALVLGLMERNMPLDEVIFFDTGMEFEAIYNLRDKVKEVLKSKNIKFTVLKDKNSFEYNAFERIVHKKNGTIHKGYDWCGGVRRWGTSSKTNAIKSHYNEHYPNEQITEYIGIAFDEQQRAKESTDKIIKTYPLIEWKMTEKDCLDYCYSKGYNWNEDGIDLYSVLDRVSCWCCANKNQKELRNIKKFLPEYWNKLWTYENRCGVPYKKKGMQYFEEKFNKEEVT